MGVVEVVEWACVLCGHHTQNDWASRATNMYQILCEAWTFLRGNYLDDSEGHSYEQLVIGNTNTTTHLLMYKVLCRVFWRNIKLPRWLSTGLVHCNFWLFLKLKSPLKGKRIQTIDEILENWMGQLMAVGRPVWGPKVPTLKGTEASLSCVQCFLYLVSSSINVSIFPIIWLDTFWTDLIYPLSDGFKYPQK